MIELSQSRVCDVCRLLDSDISKKICGYCSLCDAWICSGDQYKWGRRLLAAAKRRLEPDFSGQSSYVEDMKNQLDTKSVSIKPLIDFEIKPSINLNSRQGIKK